MRQAAELVDVVLEGVRVDRAESDPERRGVLAELGEVVDVVPRDVQRDARSETGQGVHLRGVGELLERVARHARLGEHLEPGARVAERPRRHLDRLLLRAAARTSADSSMFHFRIAAPRRHTVAQYDLI